MKRGATDSSFAKFLKGGSEQAQSGGDVAASDSNRSLIASAVKLPAPQRMPFRMVEQHVCVVASR